MERNDDFVKGMRFLHRKCRETGINIHKYPWVCELSRLLSEYNACYKFWFNVWKQGRIRRITECNTPDDIMFTYNKTLFTWERTTEGGDFWHYILAEKLFPCRRRSILPVGKRHVWLGLITLRHEKGL